MSLDLFPRNNVITQRSLSEIPQVTEGIVHDGATPTLSNENPFVETDALLRSWKKEIDPEWDARSRAIEDMWAAREAEELNNAEIVLSRIKVGLLTEKQLARMDPTARIRTTYVAPPEAPTPGLVDTIRSLPIFFKQKSRSSQELAQRLGFDLRAETRIIHDRIEDGYWDGIEAELQKIVADNSELANNGTRLDAALQQVIANAGPFLHMTELEKWGIAGALDIEDMPPEGSRRFRVYSAVKKGVAAIARTKPIAKLQLKVGQLQSSIGNTVRGFEDLPMRKKLLYGTLGVMATSTAVGAGITGLAQQVPSETDFFNAVMTIADLDNLKR